MNTAAVYRTSPTKRARRTREEVSRLCDAMMDIIGEERPMTVRQMFYRMVSQGLIDKTEAEYKNTVCRLLARLREEGTLPYHWIADSTRWMRVPDTHNSVEEALRETARFYKRNLWRDADHRVEVWLEKDALSGVLFEVTHDWHVPLMVTRGYPSLSFLHSSAMAIRQDKKPTYIYYSGDHDPSGKDIARSTEQRLRQYAPDCEIHFELVAVTPEQIRFWDLPTRPTKRTDSRAKNWEGGSVEVDAIPSRRLMALAEERILRHLDMAQVEAIRTTEAFEREALETIAERWVTTA